MQKLIDDYINVSVSVQNLIVSEEDISVKIVNNDSGDIELRYGFKEILNDNEIKSTKIRITDMETTGYVSILFIEEEIFSIGDILKTDLNTFHTIIDIGEYSVTVYPDIPNIPTKSLLHTTNKTGLFTTKFKLGEVGSYTMYPLVKGKYTEQSPTYLEILEQYKIVKELEKYTEKSPDVINNVDIIETLKVVVSDGV